MPPKRVRAASQHLESVWRYCVVSCVVCETGPKTKKRVSRRPLRALSWGRTRPQTPPPPYHLSAPCPPTLAPPTPAP